MINLLIEGDVKLSLSINKFKGYEKDWKYL